MRRRGWAAGSATTALVRPALVGLALVGLPLVGFALALGGCGSSESGGRPVPKPLKLTVVPYRPAPPQLPAGHPAGALYVLDLTNIGRIRPAKLAFASDGVLLRLKWTSWGGPVAVAHGTALLRDCRPDCATGPLVPYPGTVTLSRVKSCDQARFYIGSEVVAETKHGPWQLGSFMRNPCAPPQP